MTDSNIYRQYKVFDTIDNLNSFLDSPYAETQRLIELDMSERLCARYIDNKNPKEGFQLLSIIGYCAVCDKAVPFKVDLQFSDGKKINFRERLVCSCCGLCNRQRLLYAYITDVVRSDAKIYIQEQVTEFYKSLCKRFYNVTGSEFIGDDIEPGNVVKDIRHENCMNLSFENETYDVVISQDVLEHIPDIISGLSEIYRILTTNGMFVFSIPFCSKTYDTVQRASMRKGEIIYHKEPVYHGDPMRKGGALVFYDFGTDIINNLKTVGFKSVKFVSSDDYSYGHYARPFFFVAEK